MCSIGKKHRDARSLAATLEENGFPVNSSVTLSFATELLERLPSTGSTPSKGGVSAYKMKEKEAARAARKNEGYGLLLDDEDDEDDEAAELERAMDKARSRADWNRSSGFFSRQCRINSARLGGTGPSLAVPLESVA